MCYITMVSKYVLYNHGHLVCVPGYHKKIPAQDSIPLLSVGYAGALRPAHAGVLNIHVHVMFKWHMIPTNKEVNVPWVLR